jgi:hypothetical protein
MLGRKVETYVKKRQYSDKANELTHEHVKDESVYLSNGHAIVIASKS